MYYIIYLLFYYYINQLFSLKVNPIEQVVDVYSLNSTCIASTTIDTIFPYIISVIPYSNSKYDIYHNLNYNELSRGYVPSSVISIHIKNKTDILNSNDINVFITLFNEKNEILFHVERQLFTLYNINLGPLTSIVIVQIYVEGKGMMSKVRGRFHKKIQLKPSISYYKECEEYIKDNNQDHKYIDPPTGIPPQLCSEYTNNGQIPVIQWYFDDTGSQSYLPRTLDQINMFIQFAKEKRQFYYGKTDEYLYSALLKYPIKGKTVLIVGSNVPWYESICLAYDADTCMTIDYNKLNYNHPKLITYTLDEAYIHLIKNNITFDCIFSISSLEHDGLGRYGDPLNPNADIEAMNNLLKYAHDHTLLYLAIPVGKDTIVWNAQRIYGRVRLPLLLTAWKWIESFGFNETKDFEASEFSFDHQPILLLRPK